MTTDEKTPDFTFTDPDSGAEPKALPRIDFSTFVLSLAASAMVDMGRAPGPEGADKEGAGQSQVDLVLARQTIDTLEMIQDKTRGNLEEDEAKLLQTVLYELRMAFVQAKG
jgi:hypothetical protein